MNTEDLSVSRRMSTRPVHLHSNLAKEVLRLARDNTFTEGEVNFSGEAGL